MNKSLRFSIHGPMKCGQSEAQERVYKRLVGKSGLRWLVAIQPNEADNVYVEGSASDGKWRGFGGATLKFPLESGEVLELSGPWHSNADSLFLDTGYDCRDKHLTYGIVAEENIPDFRNGDLYKKILHLDPRPTLGRYDRIEDIAKLHAYELGKTVHYAMKSSGGGSAGPVNPD